MGKDSPGPSAYIVENDTIKDQLDRGKGVVMLGRNFPGKPNIQASGSKSRLNTSAIRSNSPGPASYNLAGSMIKKNAVIMCSAEKESIFDPKFVNPNNVPGVGQYHLKS